MDMADSKKPSIGNSVTYKIGGRNYSASNVFQLKPSQTGNAKTGADINREAVNKVQTQTDNYNKTGVYNLNKTGIPQTAGSASYVSTRNTKIQTPISGEAINTSDSAIRDRIDKSPVNIAGIQTGSVRMTKGIYTSFFDAVNSTKNKPFNLANGVTMAVEKTGSVLSGQDDFGTQSAGVVIGAGIAGAKTLRVTQAVVENAPLVVKTVAQGIYKTGKGIYQVGLTGGLVMVAVSRTAAFVQAKQFQAISHASIQMLKAQALAVGLNQTAVSQGIIHAVNGIQTKLKNGIQTVKYVGNQIKTGYHTVKKGIRTGIRVIRGVTNGTISIPIASEAIAKYMNKAIHVGIKTGIKTGKILVVKGATKGVPFVTRKTFWGMGKLNHSFVGILRSTSTDDWALQGAANIASSTEIGLKTAVAGVKATKYTLHTAVKGGIKTGKAAITTGRFIKNNGLKAAWNVGRKKAAKATVEIGKNFVTVIIDEIKMLGKKVLIPIIIIVLVVMGFNGVIMVPINAVSSIFSSMFSQKDTNMDYDVREYLNTIVPRLSTDFQQDLANQMTQSWNSYNIVRFYSNTGSAEVVEPTLAGITSIFPTTEELLNMIQPIFNAVVLMEYELEPTELEVQNLTKDIFSRLFTVTTATSTEYCGQNIKNGEGTPLAHHFCGSIHALDDCPNKIIGTHSSYTCDSCCYYYCPGHDDGEGGTDYCEGCQHQCNGYSYCGGHSVISYTLSVDGIYRLEAEYFLDPIEELSNKLNRTEDEEAKLQELKDYYEIFQEMMSQVSVNYGGGLTMADLSGVVFINGTRTSNQEVINLALSQVGQAGGQPYWSYYGFSSRVEWCACFVHWCMRHTPSASGAYPTTSNNAYCQTIANNFMAIGQWGDRGYTNIVAGDTIFFDWQGDGHTDHIGLVIGTDGTNVYTVEGNAGDAVKLRSYPIGSSVIYGYGLLNY